jgi:hypothetical protein
MKKKIMMIVSMVVMSSAAVFAGGAQDDDAQSYGPGSGGRAGGRAPQGRFDDERGGGRFGDPSICYDAEGNEIQLEEMTVSGTLVLEEGTMPYLNTAEGKVFLMVPRFMVYELELAGGESVKVTGFDVPATPWGEEHESTFLRVTDAEIDGKQIVFMGGAGGRGGRGGKGGRPGMGGMGAPRTNAQ